jgi:PAS domain S-box-containing protein
MSGDMTATGTQEVHEALRLSEKRYRSLLEATFEGIIVIKDDRIIEVNKGAEHIFGYPSKELVGMSPLSLVVPKWREDVVYFIENDLNEPHELEVLRRDDSSIWVEVIGKHMPFKDGIARVAAIRDITARREAERALKESEERYRTLLESTFDGIVVQEGDMVLDVNDGAAELFGYSRDEMSGMKTSELVSSEHQRMVFVNTDTDFDRPYEFTGVRSDGVRIDIEAIGKRMPYQGRLVRIAAVRDITSRKRIEDELRESEGRLRDLLDNVSDLFQSVDEQGRVEFVNKAWLDTMGYSAEEVHHLSLWDVIHPDCWPYCKDVFRKVLEGEEVRGVEVTFRSKSGELVELEGNVNSMRVNGGSVVTRGVFRDVTEKKSTERFLQETRERARMFMRMVTENVMTLNKSIITHLELAMRGDGIPEMALDQMKRAINEAMALRGLLNSIVEMAQVAERHIALIPTNAGHVIKNALDRTLTKYPERNIQLRTVIPSAQISVLASDHIGDVFFHIVDNAVKHNPLDTVLLEVSVAATDDGGYWRFELADNGPGVPDEVKQILLHQHPPSEGSIDGPGVDLFFVNMAVSRMNGKVWIEDRVEGDHEQGAKFVVLLPRTDDIPMPADEEPDDPGNRMVIPW